MILILGLKMVRHLTVQTIGLPNGGSHME